jgi:hypothetical protein
MRAAVSIAVDLDILDLLITEIRSRHHEILQPWPTHLDAVVAGISLTAVDAFGRSPPQWRQHRPLVCSNTQRSTICANAAPTSEDRVACPTAPGSAVRVPICRDDPTTDSATSTAAAHHISAGRACDRTLPYTGDQDRYGHLSRRDGLPGPDPFDPTPTGDRT